MALDPQAIAEHIAEVLDYPEGMDESIAKLKELIETMIQDMADTAEWGEKWGNTAIGDTSDTVAVSFGTAYPSDSYAVVFCVRNTVDPTLVVLTGTITTKNASGFTITFPTPTDSGNYVLEWRTKAVGPA